ncbi:PEP-CTERM sorting domain-containing protein [Phycisphaeraceae bacterium D3-23]
MKRTALLLGAAMVFGFPQHAMAGTETVAVTGEQAGGVPAGAVFDALYAPILNDLGQVAYRAELLTGAGGVTSDNDRGIWLGSTLIAREGNEAFRPPNGAVFDDLFSPGAINNSGQVVYEGFLRIGPGGVTFRHDEGIWIDSTRIYSEGDQAGNTPTGALFSAFEGPVVNDAGQVAYFAELEIGAGGVVSGNDVGIWLDNRVIAREGNQAGGTPGAVFSAFNRPVLNNAGQVAYRGTLLNNVGGVSSLNNIGIWLDDTLIAREGSQAGGTPAGAVFSDVGSPRLNDAGQAAYLGSLRTGVGGVDSSNDTGIWRDNTLIAREGSQAGGVLTGAVFGHFLFDDVVLSNSGQVAYRGFLQSGAGAVTDVNNAGIWRDSTLLAREGSQASGTPDGAVFASFSEFAINDAGQVVYEAHLRNGTGGVDFTNDEGLWIAGTNGESLLVVRSGDTLAGRTVGGDFIFSGVRLNNFSQVAYHALFTNFDRGIFLYTPDIHWTRTSSNSWDTANNWTIGQLPGDPHDVFIDPDVSLTVTGPGGDVNLTNLTVGGNNGIATLSLNGGTITAENAVTVTDTGVLTGDGAVGGDVDNFGTVLADNLTVAGTLHNFNLIAGSGRINAEVTNDGRIEAIGTASAPAELRFDGEVRNRPGTGLIVSRNSTLRFNAGLTNHGALAVSFGTSDMFGDIDNTGSIVLSGGSNTTFYDDVTNNGGIVVAAAGNATSTAVFFGDVSGAGSITGGGNVFLHGDLRPGNSPAAVHHDAHLFLMATATTQIELGGTTPGSQHDQINNLKSTTLGGTLDIQLINGFDPAQGETFDIFNLATSSGTFADILLPLLDSGLGWHLGKLYTDGELHVELAGDLNQDGFVGAADLDLLLAHWGESALAFDYAAGDASGDGLVGQADLAIVQANFGAGTPGGNVPEPGSLALLALGGFFLRGRRRRV